MYETCRNCHLGRLHFKGYRTNRRGQLLIVRRCSHCHQIVTKPAMQIGKGVRR